MGLLALKQSICWKIIWKLGSITKKLRWNFVHNRSLGSFKSMNALKSLIKFSYTASSNTMTPTWLNIGSMYNALSQDRKCILNRKLLVRHKMSNIMKLMLSRLFKNRIYHDFPPTERLNLHFASWFDESFNRVTYSKQMDINSWDWAWTMMTLFPMLKENTIVLSSWATQQPITQCMNLRKHIVNWT